MNSRREFLQASWIALAAFPADSRGAATQGENTPLPSIRLCCNFKRQLALGRCGNHLWFLSGQSEQLAHEPDLTSNIIGHHPPNLPLPDHVHRLITLNRSTGRVEFAEALLGADTALDRAMVLLDDAALSPDRETKHLPDS